MVLKKRKILAKTVEYKLKIWYNNSISVGSNIFMKKVEISTDFITLGQFIKYIGLISNGGEAKKFIKNEKIYINNEIENRRGRKLYSKDIILIKNDLYMIE